MMGGQIGFNSTENKGSTFWFTVILKKQPNKNELVSATPAAVSGKRVLVVDDNPTNLKLLCTFVDSWDCQHSSATNGKEALSLLWKAQEGGTPFDLAIIDYMMPEMDGEELGKIIKNEANLKDTILVMLSSRGQFADASRMKEVGFAAYLSKPIKRAQLFDCLFTLLSGRSDKPLLDGTLDAVTPQFFVNTRSTARVLVVEDNPTNQKLALRLLEKIGCPADVAGNGKEAIEALRTIAYDLVLMDVQMPEMDGFEATRIIRNNIPDIKCPGIPIVAMTAHAMKEDRERCLNAGMNDYISKPIRFEKLKKVLKKYLEQDR
jgi:CheY-like chemotaxis protein